MNKIIIIGIMLLLVLSMGCIDQPMVEEPEEIIVEVPEVKQIVISEPTKIQIDTETLYNEPVFDSYHYRNGDYVYAFYRVVNGNDENIDISANCFSFKVNNMKVSSVYNTISNVCLDPGEDIRFRITYYLPDIDETEGQSVYTPKRDWVNIRHDKSVLNESEIIAYDFSYTITKNLSGNKAEFGYTYVCVNYTVANICQDPIKIDPTKWTVRLTTGIYSPDDISYQDEFSGIDEITILPGEFYDGKLVFNTLIREDMYIYLKYTIPYNDKCIIWYNLNK